ncbi:MAG: HAD family phosphatase [Chloroflexi bacterium]|nr:HAD family phosphatase [Chloroflexota bacterium]
MPIRGLIFDFGGVISNMRWDVAHELEEEHGLERNTLLRTLYDSDEWREVQVGRGDIEGWREAAHRRLEEAAGKSLPPLHQQWRETVGLIQENVDLVRALRPPYTIAILSNADLTLEERLRDGLGIHHLFDTVISSAVVGMAKPDHRIYRLAAERVGLPPEECLFIDDAERNVEAARQVGMAAIHYRVHHGDDLAAQLAELGVRPASTT